MKLCVLGAAGAMAEVVLKDLEVFHPEAEVTAADFREFAPKTANARFAKVDVQDEAATAKLLAGHDAVLNCVTYYLNLPAMRAALAARVPYTDLGGLYHGSLKQFELDEAFRVAGVPALLGMGSTPGITNAMAGAMTRNLERVDEAHVRVGCLDRATSKAASAGGPLPIPYALDTVLDEFALEPWVVEKGEAHPVPPRSGEEEVEFPAPVGRMKAIYTLHSEVAMFARSFPGLSAASFKVAFEPKFMEKVRFLVELGFAEREAKVGAVSPRQMLLAVAGAQPVPAGTPDDCDALRVDVTGQAGGRTVRRRGEAVIRPHAEWGFGAGALDTGVPLAIAGALLARREVATPGVHCPETALPFGTFFTELARRGIDVRFEERGLTREPGSIERAATVREEQPVAIASVNPANGLTLKSFEAATPAAIDAALARAAATYLEWRKVPFAERKAKMMRAAAILEEDKRRFGETMTLEMGKPIGAAIAEVEKCAWVCRYYAEQAEAFLSPEAVITDAGRSFVRYDPIGPVLAVMPWNFPFWQVFRFAAPALMAGNVGLLKHASNVPQSALAIEEVFRRAGFPEGSFQTLLVGTEAVATMIDDPRVAAVTLTGSEGAGIAVGRAAGAQIKKAVLELGGSDPFVVMPSADVAKAAGIAVKARTINNGQSCIAAKRFIVHEAVYGEFAAAMVAGMKALSIGDPMDPATEIGPLATGPIRDELAAQVEKSVARGAKVLTGGEKLDRAGNYYAPTVLADPAPGSPAWDDELFGPVATLFRVASLDEAIALANHPVFGLGAAFWSNDVDEIERATREIEAGSVFVNGMVKSDPRLPFGGIKRSGFGRELAAQGIREFVNVKSVWIA